MSARPAPWLLAAELTYNSLSWQCLRWSSANSTNEYTSENAARPTTTPSLREATNNTEELEETARLMFTLGNREIRYLTADEVDELR